MASTVSTTFSYTLNPVIASALGNLNILASQNIVIANGTSAGQNDLVYAASRTVASSGSPDTIDLSGSLTMLDGTACVFARVTMLYIEHKGTATSDDANILTVGGGSNQFSTWLGGTTGIKVRNNPGRFFLEAGDSTAYAVTASTADILQVATAAGTNVPYIVIICGRSA